MSTYAAFSWALYLSGCAVIVGALARVAFLTWRGRP